MSVRRGWRPASWDARVVTGTFGGAFVAGALNGRPEIIMALMLAGGLVGIAAATLRQ
jgi:hypothetical protein